MKQILRDMKLNGLLGMLPRILVFGGMGAVMLIYHGEALMQLLGMKQGTSEIKKDEVIILSAMGAFLLLFALWLLIRCLSGGSQKKVREFFTTLSEGEKDKLSMDYQNAWKCSRSPRIGRLYTYQCGESSGIYKNSDIIWVYEWHESSRYGDKHYLSLYFIDKQEPEYIQVKDKAYPQILDYYKNHFPHIVVGHSDEAGYLYRHDRNQFLQLQYYNGQNKAE